MCARWIGPALLLVIASLCAGRSPMADEVRRGVQATLDAQVAAWNRGDIDEFMQGYHRSDELTFSAGGRTLRGWNATRARYRTRYADRAKMGTLAFSDLEIRRLCDDAALVLGRWRLRRAGDAPGGSFSLIMIRDAGRWVIIHDHTSADEATATAPAEN